MSVWMRLRVLPVGLSWCCLGLASVAYADGLPSSPWVAPLSQAREIAPPPGDLGDIDSSAVVGASVAPSAAKALPTEPVAHVVPKPVAARPVKPSVALPQMHKQPSLQPLATKKRVVPLPQPTVASVARPPMASSAKVRVRPNSSSPVSVAKLPAAKPSQLVSRETKAKVRVKKSNTRATS